MFVIVGDRGRDQVVNLHYILSKSSVKTRPSVLWCYKKDLGFTTYALFILLPNTLDCLDVVVTVQSVQRKSRSAALLHLLSFASFSSFVLVFVVVVV